MFYKIILGNKFDLFWLTTPFLHSLHINSILKMYFNEYIANLNNQKHLNGTGRF